MVYSRKVSDFILERDVDVAVYPTGRLVENGGDLSTKGLELSLNYDIIKKADLLVSSEIEASYTEVVTHLKYREIYSSIGEQVGYLAKVKDICRDCGIDVEAPVVEQETFVTVETTTITGTLTTIEGFDLNLN